MGRIGNRPVPQQQGYDPIAGSSQFCSVEDVSSLNVHSLHGAIKQSIGNLIPPGSRAATLRKISGGQSHPAQIFHVNDHQFIALRLVNQVNEALREDIIARHAVALSLQKGAGAGAVGIRPSRIALYVSRVGVRYEFKRADVSCLVYLVAVGVSVARQVTLELHPVHSLDASLFVSVNKEMLLGIGDVVKDETVTAGILEALVKFNSDGGHFLRC